MKNHSIEPYQLIFMFLFCTNILFTKSHDLKLYIYKYKYKCSTHINITNLYQIVTKVINKYYIIENINDYNIISFI